MKYYMIMNQGKNGRLSLDYSTNSYEHNLSHVFDICHSHRNPQSKIVLILDENKILIHSLNHEQRLQIEKLFQPVELIHDYCELCGNIVDHTHDMCGTYICSACYEHMKKDTY